MATTSMTLRSPRTPNFTCAGLEGEKCVVAAAADVDAGMEVRAALPDDDLAGLDDLAAEALDAEALRVGVATVARGAGALLVCHFRTCSRLGLDGRWRPDSLDAGDLEARQRLAVTLPLAGSRSCS